MAAAASGSSFSCVMSEFVNVVQSILPFLHAKSNSGRGERARIHSSKWGLEAPLG